MTLYNKMKKYALRRPDEEPAGAPREPRVP
jgi:hypothetical protein